MKAKILYLFLLGILFACNSEDINMDANLGTNAPNQVLLLKVDYTTNTFEGGTIFGFPQKSDNFTIENKYVEPGDFGNVKLIYKEPNQTLFEGTIHWMGLGKMTFPEKLEPAKDFEIDPSKNYILPKNGFEDIFNPDKRELNYEKPWNSIQGLEKVREFLATNPNQKAKLFLYTPSVGEGDPKDWYWIIYLRK